jgi:hypothetical protein
MAFTVHAVENLFINSYYNDYEFIDFVLDRSIIDENIINKLCTSQSTVTLIKLEGVIKKYCGIMTKYQLDKLCNRLPFTSKIIENILRRTDLVLDSDSLMIACKILKPEAIKYVLDHKVVPSKIHLITLLDKNKKEYNPIDVEMLFKYGYKPDYSDVENSIIKKRELPGLGRFNIQYDSKLMDLCDLYNFYPNYPFINNKMLQLRTKCKNSYMSDIRDFMDNDQLTPDAICMKNASNHRSNNGVLRFLVSRGGKIDIECIRANAQNYRANGTLLYLIDKFSESHNFSMDCHNDNVTTKNNEIITLQNTIKKLKNKIKELENVSNSKSNNITNNISTDNILTDNEVDIEDLNFIEIITKSTCVSKRKRDIPPEKYIKYIANKKEIKKEIKMSFFDIRKEFIQDINNNGWYMGQNKMIINLPSEVKNNLEITDSGYIKFEDIDKIIYKFYE